MTMSIFDDEFIQKAHDDRVYQDGVAEGTEKTRKEDLEALNAMLQRMLAKGYPCEEVASISGRSIDEVNALKASMTLSGSKA